MEETTTTPPGDGQAVFVALDLIDVTENPRNVVDKELRDSIAAQGVLTPLLVRPCPQTPGRYRLVAGGRRFAACTELKLATVPVLVRDMDDAQARRAALAENTDRASLTPLEEAEAAARVLGDLGGDREQAALAMGWKPDLLQRRLALMACSPAVRDALRSDKILLGHAELLAALRHAKQDAALEAISNMPQRPTVAELKAQIERMALNLESAIFDKAECVACPHNSGVQRSMFSEAIADALCTNRACFDAKTEQTLQMRADHLSERYQTVRIVRPGDNYTVTKLTADGPHGVGAEQAQACRSCGKFGAVVSALPQGLGNAYVDQCMDTVCHTQMVAARVKSERAAAQAASSRADEGATQTASVTGADEQTAVQAAGVGAKPARETPAASKATAVASKAPPATPKTYSRPVLEYREKLWRDVLARVLINADPVVNRAVLLSLCLSNAGVISGECVQESARIVGVELPLARNRPGDALPALLALEREALGKAMQCIVAGFDKTLDVEQVRKILRVLKVDLGAYWKIQKSFLELLTKNEIEALCVEIGAKAAFGDKFTKTMSGKKDEVIAAVLGLPGFDFKGKIPRAMSW